MHTQADIDAMIVCPKTIVEPPRKEIRLERGHRRNGMVLRSDQFDGDCTVLMRINEDFPENFSIGLDFTPRYERGTIPLLRCNGPRWIGRIALRPHSGHRNLNSDRQAVASAIASEGIRVFRVHPRPVPHPG